MNIELGVCQNKDSETLLATVLFPTPPFPLATARTRPTLGMGLRDTGAFRVGIVGGGLDPDLGSPYRRLLAVPS